MLKDARHSMERYRHSEALERMYETLVAHLVRRGIDVALVLSPYHPQAYREIIELDLAHPKVERDFREFAERLGVGLVGSYDPVEAGCAADEFYDGMHPKPACLKKILAPLL